MISCMRAVFNLDHHTGVRALLAGFATLVLSDTQYLGKVLMGTGILVGGLPTQLCRRVFG